MPYEFKIGQLGDVLIGTYGDYIVDFDLGEDSDSIDTVQMMVGLTEDDHTGSDPFELLFGIRRRSLETGITTPPRYNHATACQYIPKSQRNAVMLLILASVRKLVEFVNPDRVVMVTYEPDLPVVAMGKYMRICNYMGLLGYTQTEYRRDGTDLKDYWLFTK
jgi:hypothetical protein